MPNDKRPPKKWWDSKVKEVKKGNPDYTDEQVRGTVGKIWWENMSQSERDKVRKGSMKKKADFKDLLNKRYADWVVMDARLRAQNNYGTWSSVEEANSLVDKAIKDVTSVLVKGLEQEVQRLVDEERPEIVEEMTEDMVEGADLPQMGPDQPNMPPAQEGQPSVQQQQAPQQKQEMAPLPAHKILKGALQAIKVQFKEGHNVKKAKMTKELKAAFEKSAQASEDWDTQETWRWLMNDEFLYKETMRAVNSAWDISKLAGELEGIVSQFSEASEHFEVDLSSVDFHGIAEELLEESEEE